MTNKEENGIILRSPDNTCNPYFALGLIIYACLEGALMEEKLCEPANFDTRDVAEEKLSTIATLPQSLNEAIEIAKTSEFIKNHLPENLIEHVINVKTKEAEEYDTAEDKEMFETLNYFFKI